MNATSQSLTQCHNNVPYSAMIMIGMLTRLQTGHLRLITPDGQMHIFGSSKAQPSATLHIRDWRACKKILRHRDIGFAEAYRDGWLDSPDLAALLRVILLNERAIELAKLGTRLSRWWYRLKHALRKNHRKGSQRNIHDHYDIGNAFYQLWLDKTWSYSSAWFDGNYSQSLEQAQLAKYKRIFEQLALKPGMKILEIGCGWGGFAAYVAERGVSVYGITLSKEQLVLASEHVAHLPNVTLALCDYRDVNGQYDAIVSVEMFEAVGEAYWPDFFACLRRNLKPNAKALVQTITIDDQRFDQYRAGSDFIQQFIFPGGMLPSPQRFVEQALHHHLHTANQLDFGKDYAETLRRWRQYFETRLDLIRMQGFDDAFIRLWRLYFCYCEAGFDHGRIGVSQFLLSQE